MKCKFFIPIVVVVFFAPTLAFGQNFIPTALRSDNLNIRGLSKKVEPAGWLYLKDETQVWPNDLFSIYKKDMGLGDDDAMVVSKDETDKYGWRHIRYQQYYKNLKVEGAEYTEHIKDCYVKIAHGKLLENADKPQTPTIEESDALKAALDHLGERVYSWEDSTIIVEDEPEEEDIFDNEMPKGELLLAYFNQDGILPENYKLSWRFEIFSVHPGEAVEIYIDAFTGDVIKEGSLEFDNGPAVLLYNYGTQTIDTKFYNGLFSDYHYLKAEDNDRNIHTKIGSFADHGTKWSLYDNAKDDNDNWGAVAGNWTTAHWVVSQSWDYYSSVHNRNGFNGDGKRIRVLANSTIQNAVFRPEGDGWIEFGNINGNQLAAVDVGGHEFAHGVTRYISGLGGAGQPGALNESFSDIFGSLVERFTFPNNFDWLIGEDPFPGGLRSLENPGSIIVNAFPDRPASGLPNVFMGERWYDGNFDAGGVHINCGPQNRWFNLLSVGGLETETGINVQGIGIDNAAEITYYSLNAFIQAASEYPDAQLAAIASATIIFGECSFEVEQTTNAWAAVGIGNIFDGPCLQLSGPDLICGEPEGLPEIYHAFASSGSIITWNVPITWSFTLSGPGNNTLTLNSVIPPPPPAPAVNSTISATSSMGGTSALNVVVEFDCGFHPLCDPENRAMNFNYQEPESQYQVQNKVFVFPNPASNILAASVNTLAGSLNINIFDIYGQKVLTTNSESYNILINIEELQPGIYFLEVSGNTFKDLVSFCKI